MDVPAHQPVHRPLIAILTMDDDEERFRGNRSNFVDLIRTGAEMGVLVCVVTVNHLKLKQKRIVAYMYDPVTKTWSQQLVGLPHVIYNRIPHRQDEKLPEVQKALKAALKHPEIKLFNPFFFNKWSLFEWLGKGKTTARYIPATRKMSSLTELAAMLRRYPVVYLKPILGKAGKGIMRVEKIASGAENKTEYVLTVQETKGSESYKFGSIAQLWSNIQKETEHQPYIVQRGISLAKHRKRPFDLRLLVQKNYRGEWAVTGVGARLAGKQSITTHVPRGGSIDDPEKLLASAFDEETAKRIVTRAKNAALAIARQIERKSGHKLGEMSMDIGVDVQGGIWFFEANSKPMKFDEPHIRKKSLERIIQYALHLIRTNRAKTSGISASD